MSRVRVVGAVARCFGFARKLGLTGAVEPIITVNEFPKSGGTWLAKMLSVLIGVPFIDNSVFPPGMPCVIRTHWVPDSRLVPCVFVIRDYRDVIISLFHHRVKNIGNTKKLRSLYRAKLGEDLSIDKISSQLSGFIEVEFNNKRYGSYIDWAGHVSKVLELSRSEKRLCIVKYEDMLVNPERELSRVASELLNISVNKEKLILVAKLHSIGIVKDSPSIDSKETTFIRKGEKGDWKNHFTRDAAESVDFLVGEWLVELGYEQNRDWWKSVPEM